MSLQSAPAALSAPKPRHKKPFRLHGTTILAGLLPMVLAGMSPQSAQALAAEDSVASFGLEEIVVTARKRAENLKEIPDSITAFTSSMIEATRIADVKDVAVRVPNLSIVEAQQPGVALINIRGIGQARNGEPSVAVVIDGVQLSNAYGITQDLFDVERIEVLKGPQGATYGRNAIGGAINITTRKPGNEFAGSVLGEYGSGDDLRLNASLSGPIVEDKLLFRVAGSLRSFDGDIDSLFTPGRDKANYQDDRNIRASLLAKPSDLITVDLRYSRQQTKSGAAWYTTVAPGEDINEPRPFEGDHPSRAKRVLNDASAKIDFDFGDVGLTSVTAYSKTYSFIDEDLDFTPLNGILADQTLRSRNWTQELRLASTNDSPFKWMGGVYYLNTHQKLDTQVYLGRDFFPFFNLPDSLPSPLPLSASRSTDKNDAYAAFGQMSYRFPSGLELTAAARYDIDKREQFDRVLLGPPINKTFKSLQPKASVSYFFGDDQMVYATVAKGFRSGGFNPNDRIQREFDKEENWNYEAGFKTSLLDRRVSLSGAAFYTRIRDRQVYILDLATSAQVLNNPIKRAEVYGFELDLLARPVQGLDLSASIGFTDSKILRYDPSVLAVLGITQDFTGNKLPQISDFSYALSAQYEFPASDDVTVTPRVELNGTTGDYYWEIDNVNNRSSITLMNARLTVAYRTLSLTAYVENLFDDGYVLEYVAALWSGGSTGDVSAAARGRHYGVQARYRF